MNGQGNRCSDGFSPVYRATAAALAEAARSGQFSGVGRARAADTSCKTVFVPSTTCSAYSTPDQVSTSGRWLAK